MRNSYPVSTFGHIYQQALETQLKKIGNLLSLMRKTRQEDIDSVAAAINLRPSILQQIENGDHDFRLKTLIALCDHYEIDMESIIGRGELLHFKICTQQ